MFLAGVRDVPRGNRSLKTSLKLNMPLQAQICIIISRYGHGPFRYFSKKVPTLCFISCLMTISTSVPRVW